MNIINIIFNFLNDLLTPTEFIELIDEYLKKSSKEEIFKTYQYLVTTSFEDFDIDKLMLTLVYLLIIKEDFLLLLLNDKTSEFNEFTKFIISFLSEFDKVAPFQLLEKDDNHLICTYRGVLMILNFLEKDKKFTLPKEFQNQNLYCINCNDEIIVKTKVELYPYGFYLLKKN